jgi:hypothetical protein
MNDNSILKIGVEKMGKLKNCKAIYQGGILIKNCVENTCKYWK